MRLLHATTDVTAHAVVVVAAQMDAAIVHLFDPHGYLGRALSILQSSPSAVSIVSKHPHQVSR